MKTTLEARLAELREGARQRLPAETLELIADSIQELVAEGLEEQALKNGDRPPDFSLDNATRETVRLSDLLQQGPVVLCFYRGNW